MAARKRKRPLRPRVPSRVKRRRQRRARSHRENELFGLALSALGLVLCAILYLGLDGGAVGSWLADALRDVFGNAAYVLPLALLAVGGLLLARSELLDVRPFRLGLGVGFLGLMVLLGQGQRRLDRARARRRPRRAHRRHRRGDHRRRAAPRRRTARQRSLDGRDPSPHRPRRPPGRLGARRALDWTSTETQTEENYASAADRAGRLAVSKHVVDGAEAYPDVVSSTSHAGEHALLVRRRGAGATSRRAWRPSSRRRPSTPSTGCRTGGFSSAHRRRQRPARTPAPAPPSCSCGR